MIPTDVYEIAEPEDAATNAARLERLWQVSFISIVILLKSSSSLSLRQDEIKESKEKNKIPSFNRFSIL